MYIYLYLNVYTHTQMKCIFYSNDFWLCSFLLKRHNCVITVVIIRKLIKVSNNSIMLKHLWLKFFNINTVYKKIDCELLNWFLFIAGSLLLPGSDIWRVCSGKTCPVKDQRKSDIHYSIRVEVYYHYLRVTQCCSTGVQHQHQGSNTGPLKRILFMW